jgi:hypothetical protein
MFCIKMASVHIASSKCKTIYFVIMPSLLSCVNNCLIFFPWIGLNLHITVLIAQGIFASQPSKIHMTYYKVILKKGFQQILEVQCRCDLCIGSIPEVHK